MNRFIYLIFCIIFMQIPAQAESGFFSLVPGKKELRVAQSGRIKIISSAKRQNLPIQVFFDQNNNGRFESNEKVCNGFSLNKSSEFKVGESTAGPVQVHYKSGQTDLTLYPLGELYFNNPKKQDWYLIINGNPKLVKAEKDMAIYQTSNGTWLAFETINRGTLKALANTVEQESNKALSIAVHMAASQKELEAIIASIRTPHEIKAGKTALTFNHARGLYQSKMTGDFSISKVSGSRPIIVESSWSVKQGLLAKGDVSLQVNNLKTTTVLISHAAKKARFSVSSKPGLLFCSATSTNKKHRVKHAAGFYQIYFKGELIAEMNEIGIFRIRRPGGPGEKWVSGARHGMFPLHFFQNMPPTPGHKRIISCDIPDAFMLETNSADALSFLIKSRDATGNALSTASVKIPHPKAMQINLELQATFSTDEDVITDTNDSVEFFDPMGPWQVHPVYHGKFRTVKSHKTIENFGLSWYDNYHDFTFVLDTEGRFGAIENDRASAGNRLGQIRGFANDARLGIGSIVGQTNYTGPKEDRIGDIVILVKDIKTKQGPEMNFWLCPAFRDVHFRIPVIDLNNHKINKKGKAFNFVVPKGTTVSAGLSFNLFGSGIYNWEDFKYLTEARYGKALSFTGDDNGFSISFERGRYQCFNNTDGKKVAIDANGKALSTFHYNAAAKRLYAWSPLDKAISLADKGKPAANKGTVSLTVKSNRPGNSHTVSTQVRLPKGTRITKLTVNGKAIVHQIGSWADNPDTPDQEIWLSFMGANGTYTIHYEAGTIKNEATDLSAKENIEFSNAHVSIKVNKSIGPFRLNSVYGKDGKALYFTDCNEQIRGTYIGNKGTPSANASKWQLEKAVHVEKGPVRDVLALHWINESKLWRREQNIVLYKNVPGVEINQDTIWNGEKSFISAGWPGTIWRDYGFAGKTNSLSFLVKGKLNTFDFTADKTGKKAFAYDMGQAATTLVNSSLWSWFKNEHASIGLIYLTPNQQERATADVRGANIRYKEFYWLFKQDFMNKGDRFQESRFVLSNPSNWQAIADWQKNLPTVLGSLQPEHTWIDRHVVRVAKKNPNTAEKPVIP